MSTKQPVQEAINDCISELEILKYKVSSDTWVNAQAQKSVAQGVQLSIDKLDRMLKEK